MGDVDTASVRLGGKCGRCVSAGWLGDADAVSKRGWMEDVDNMLGGMEGGHASCGKQYAVCSSSRVRMARSKRT